MQATVSSYDRQNGSGTVLLDDGVELSFDTEALATSGLRLLRPGQRVRLETSEEGGSVRVCGLQIVTLA